MAPSGGLRLASEIAEPNSCCFPTPTHLPQEEAPEELSLAVRQFLDEASRR
jgi:hypothetical protein